jgi:hypothetical protein
MGLEENKAVVQRFFDAINSGNLDELPQVVAPDVVDHNAVIVMQPEGPGVCRASACCWKGSRICTCRPRS